LDDAGLENAKKESVKEKDSLKVTRTYSDWFDMKYHAMTSNVINVFIYLI
jgi:hypothetical protein